MSKLTALLCFLSICSPAFATTPIDAARSDQALDLLMKQSTLNLADSLQRNNRETLTSLIAKALAANSGKSVVSSNSCTADESNGQRVFDCAFLMERQESPANAAVLEVRYRVFGGRMSNEHFRDTPIMVPAGARISVQAEGYGGVIR